MHDQGRYNVLKEIHRALERDGVYLMQDIKGSSHVYKKSSRRDTKVGCRPRPAWTASITSFGRT